MASLWKSLLPDEWAAALGAYPAVVAAQGVSDLAELDRWYREELPGRIAERQPPCIHLDELVEVVRWKMKRGEWRARNLALVKGNPAELVRATSARAFALLAEVRLTGVEDPASDPWASRSPLRQPLALLSELAGVGPATASAVLAAHRGDLYPFLDELVGAAIPELGAPQFTPAYYARYAEALRRRAAELGPPWTAQQVGLALWSAAGGKAGA